MNLFLTLLTTYLISVRMQSGYFNILKLPLSIISLIMIHIYIPRFCYFICIGHSSWDWPLMQYFISVIIFCGLYLWLKKCLFIWQKVDPDFATVLWNIWYVLSIHTKEL